MQKVNYRLAEFDVGDFRKKSSFTSSIIYEASKQQFNENIEKHFYALLFMVLFLKDVKMMALPPIRLQWKFNKTKSL